MVVSKIAGVSAFLSFLALALLAFSGPLWLTEGLILGSVVASVTAAALSYPRQ